MRFPSLNVRHARRSTAAQLVLTMVLALWSASPVAAQENVPTVNPDADAYILPPPSVQELFATDKNYASLEYASPDGDHFLVPLVTELSTLERMAEETYRLAELELRPRSDRLWHLDTYGIYGIRIYSLDDRAFTDIDLPEDAFFSDFTWSMDGGRLAFLAHLDGGTEVWTLDVASGRAAPLSDARVIATIGTSAGGQGSGPSRMLQWTPEGTVITLLAPEGRGAEPPEPAVPSSPIVRKTRDEPTPTRTFPNLLNDEHDEDLFEYHTTSQIAELAEGRAPRRLGPAGMYESIALSADGQHLIATQIERPFSFITSYRGFPRTTAIIDRSGERVAVLDEQPLREGGGGRGGDAGPRSFQWRPDGAGLSYLQRAEASDGEEERPDRVMVVQAPFDLDGAEVVVESADPIGSATYSLDGEHLFTRVSRSGESGIAHWDLSQQGSEPTMVLELYETNDPTEQPGDLWSMTTSNGLSYALVSDDDGFAYLEGDGYKDDFRPQPFVDRVDLENGATVRVFEGSRDSFDQPLLPLDGDLDRMIVSSESKTDFPDSFLWSRGGDMENLTNNVDPFPAITAARRMDFEFERQDGLTVHGRVSLPTNYQEGERVPAIFWTYPREYEEAEEYQNAVVRSRNHNAFTHLSWLRWSDIWLTQGYALVYPEIPIIGENYNDTYIASLVDAMYGAIRAVDGLGVIDIDRIGHGGHSYGAFATANILANSPYFKAGIAGDGAYNRTLTPAGFQAERRIIWEAPHTYVEMSPFFRADQINTPLLMYHGGDDNNTGTFPVQSRRMIHALTTLGKTAVLYEYPFESHTPRAMENKLDMWARFIGWFDEYVKGAGGEARAVSEEGG